MANSYFDTGDYTAPVRSTLARAQTIVNIALAVEAGFDLLPEPALLQLITGNFSAEGAWVTGTSYAKYDVVTNSGIAYVCLTAHTSGTFATDLAASKWMAIGASSAASAISYTPAGSLSSTDVQAALTELDTEKQPLDTELTALAALTSAADRLPYFTGSGAAALATFTAFGRTLAALADAAAGLTALGAQASATALTQGLHSIWIPAAAMRPTVSFGCSPLTQVETTAGRPDMNVLDFVASDDRHAQFEVCFPKSWDEGTITFRVHHTTTATDTDGVAWALQGVAVSDGDTIDVAYGTAVVVTDAYQSTAEDEYVTATSGAVTIAGTPAAGDRVVFRIFRDVSDAADTATEDARLLGVEIFFTVNAGNDA